MRVEVEVGIDDPRFLRGPDRGRRGAEVFPTLTYGGPDPYSGGTTRGGFSTTIVVDRHFVHALPDALDPAAAAPLLCAGVTTYAPLRRFGAGPGTAVGVVGVGGLGHLAIRLSRALGAHTVAFTTSDAKRDAALALGADEVVVSRDAEAMAGAFRSLDLVLDTTGADLAIAPYLNALDVDGTYVLAGIPSKPLIVDPTTRELLDFCAGHGIVADVEVLSPDEIGKGLDRPARGDVRFRFVVDMTRA